MRLIDADALKAEFLKQEVEHNQCDILWDYQGIREVIDGEPTIKEYDCELGLEEGIRCALCRNPMHTDRGCDGTCDYDVDLYNELLDVVQTYIRMPSTIEPVRHGHWIISTISNEHYTDRRAVCSECKAVVWHDDEIDEMDEVYWRYCPCCGASMEREET